MRQVNRHIKDLERAIKEQETSISLGLRPGTHPASIILPELVIPKSRPPGTVHDDLSDSDENTRDVTEEPPQDSVQDVVEEEKPMKTPRKKGRVKHPRKKSDVEVADQENVEVDKAEASDGRPSRSSRSLKLTLPALSAINSQKDTVIDSDEPRYCYCNQVSYGEVHIFWPTVTICPNLLAFSDDWLRRPRMQVRMGMFPRSLLFLAMTYAGPVSY